MVRAGHGPGDHQARRQFHPRIDRRAVVQRGHEALTLEQVPPRRRRAVRRILERHRRRGVAPDQSIQNFHSNLKKSFHRFPLLVLHTQRSWLVWFMLT